jgi:PPOX class probable F420-dependent enzyme
MDAEEVVDMTLSTAGLPSLGSLARERYISITTFKRDGTPVSTPVWVVSDRPERLLVATGASTWKVKRIKRDQHVRVAGCSARGKVHGEAVDGIARFVDEEPLVRRLQYEKYGWQKRLLEWFYGLVLRVTRKPRPEETFIEIVAAPESPPRQADAA